MRPRTNHSRISMTKKRPARRVGGHIESLEDRQMMFGDGAMVADHALVGVSPAGPIFDIPSLDLPAVPRSADCIDFQDLPAAGAYHVGDVFVADNTGLQARFRGEDFTWSGGGTTSGGVAQVSHGQLAGHLGQDIAVNNILLDVDFGGPVNDLRMEFGEYGGNLNLEINGDFRNFENFQDIHGAVVGGSTVSILAGGFGQDEGTLLASGNINSFKVGGQELWIDHICVGQLDDARYDFGDAPDRPYPTLLAHSGARHRIDPDVFLGDRVEPEADGQPTLASDGDDQATGGMIDDEDGVRFLTPLVPGNPAQVEVVASTDGWLNAWVDFNRDGTWDTGAPEQIFHAQPLAPGANVLTFMVPADAKPGPNEPTYSRWRFSNTDRDLKPEHQFGADGYAPNGEVEDHLAFIQERDPDPQDRYDFGDAPDRPYPTLLANDGARHLINREVYLGQWVEPDADGQPTFMARGDDQMDATDDEDGVRFLTPVVPGVDVKVEVLASVDGYLDAWIDLNQDGSWTPDEQIATSTFVHAGANTIEFVVPKEAIPRRTRPVYSRFRFSTHGGLAPDGAARDGEVEDYALLHGDMNDDGVINARDIGLLCHAIHAGDASADLNGDGVVDDHDMDYLITEILGTTYGDANLDGVFNSADIIQVFGAGEYEDGVAGNSTWAEGDWNCDGDFDSSDLIKAMQAGGYVASSRTAAIAAAVDAIFADSSPSDRRRG